MTNLGDQSFLPTNLGHVDEEMVSPDRGVSHIEDPVQLEDRIRVGNLPKGLSLIEKLFRIVENTYSKAERIFSTKEGIKILAGCEEILLKEKKKSSSRQTTY
ncbi:hypothetical protein TNCV_4183021 [Trichonephila clavipes]|nr:hypothetical protein TNCV_4183021 [Trichonephila clavipes]